MGERPVVSEEDERLLRIYRPTPYIQETHYDTLRKFLPRRFI